MIEVVYNPKIGLIAGKDDSRAAIRKVAIKSRVPFFKDSFENIWVTIFVPLRDKAWEAIPYHLGKLKDHPRLNKLLEIPLPELLRCSFCKNEWEPKVAREKYQCPRCKRIVYPPDHMKTIGSRKIKAKMAHRRGFTQAI